MQAKREKKKNEGVGCLNKNENKNIRKIGGSLQGKRANQRNQDNQAKQANQGNQDNQAKQANQGNPKKSLVSTPARGFKGSYIHS